VEEIPKCHYKKIKAIEQYFPVVLFIALYKVVLGFESVHEIPKCDHSNESYWAVLSCGTVYYAVQGGSKFESMDKILKCYHLIKWTLLKRQFCPAVLFIMLYNVRLTS